MSQLKEFKYERFRSHDEPRFEENKDRMHKDYVEDYHEKMNHSSSYVHLANVFSFGSSFEDPWLGVTELLLELIISILD